MKNWKDSLSTIVAVISAIVGFIVLLSLNGLAMPQWVLIVSASLPSFLTTLLAIFQGKNPDLSAKTEKQLKQTALLK